MSSSISSASPRYSVTATQNVLLITDDVAKRIVDTFTPEQEDAAYSYVADLNNGDVEGMPA